MTLKFNRRKMIWLVSAAAALALLLVLELGILPFLEYRRRTERRIEAATAALAEMEALRREVIHLRQGGTDLQTRNSMPGKGFSLFTFMESQAGKTGVKAHIAYIKPTSSLGTEGRAAVAQVELKLEGIDLQQLVRYLHGVESSTERVLVSRLTVSKGGPGSGTVDAVIQAEAVEG